MIQRETKIAYDRCRLRWTIRDYMRVPRRSLFLVDLASNADPPVHMRSECQAISDILLYRKWLKGGDNPYLRAWWKARGYRLL